MQGICNNGQCVNAQGGFQCECKQGYALDDEGKDCLGRQQKTYPNSQASVYILSREEASGLSSQIVGGFSVRLIVFKARFHGG